MSCSMAERATLPPIAIKITALDCWGGCHSTSTQLQVAPSHLIYPLRDSPVQKKILQNKLKVTEQMGVLGPVGWTRWTEHCRANQETMQPGNTESWAYNNGGAVQWTLVMPSAVSKLSCQGFLKGSKYCSWCEQTWFKVLAVLFAICVIVDKATEQSAEPQRVIILTHLTDIMYS